MNGYSIATLEGEDQERLERTFADLLALSTCPVPSVRSAARAALALIAQARNGQMISYDLYTADLTD
ncbi:MAG: DUF6052 family protein [Chloroflexota bacterium]